MIWKQIPEYPWFESSNTGLIRKIGEAQSRKQYTTQFGYLGVNVYNQTRRKAAFTHRLVAAAFIPNPEGKPCVNHKDSNRQNNCVENLEWVTDAENMAHASKSGRLARGDRHIFSKVTEVQREEIRALLKRQIHSCKDIGLRYGLSKSRISQIAQELFGCRYRPINAPKKLRGPKQVKHPKQYPDALILEIQRLLGENWSRKAISEHLEVNVNLIWRVAHGWRTVGQATTPAPQPPFL